MKSVHQNVVIWTKKAVILKRDPAILGFILFSGRQIIKPLDAKSDPKLNFFTDYFEEAAKVQGKLSWSHLSVKHDENTKTQNLERKHCSILKCKLSFLKLNKV